MLVTNYAKAVDCLGLPFALGVLVLFLFAFVGATKRTHHQAVLVSDARNNERRHEADNQLVRKSRRRQSVVNKEHARCFLKQTARMQRKHVGMLRQITEQHVDKRKQNESDKELDNCVNPIANLFHSAFKFNLLFVLNHSRAVNKRAHNTTI